MYSRLFTCMDMRSNDAVNLHGDVIQIFHVGFAAKFDEDGPTVVSRRFFLDAWRRTWLYFRPSVKEGASCWMPVRVLQERIWDNVR